jgi:hypothetical protein
MDEKIILNVEIDNAQAVQNIAALRQKIDELRAAQKEQNTATEEGREEYVRLGEQIKNLNKQVAEQSRVIQDEAKAKQLDKDMTIDLNGSYNSLSQQLTKLKAAYHAAGSDEDRKKILENLTAVDSKLKELDEQQGVFTRNVGNYKSALDGYLGNNKYVAGLKKINETFGSSKGIIEGAGKAVLAFGKNMLAMLANPIVLGIAAIVLAVQQLTEAFKRNDEAMTMTQKIIAQFKAIWQSIQRLFDDIVKTIVDVYTNITKATGGFSSFQYALIPLKVLIAAVRAQFAILGNTLTVISNGIAYLSNTIKQSIQGSVIGKWVSNLRQTIHDLFSSVDSFLQRLAGSDIGKKLGLDTLYSQLKDIIGTNEELVRSNKEIADLEYNINKDRAENTKRNAEDQLAISQLREKAAQKDKVSAEERIALLSQAAKLEEDMAKRNTALAQMEYDLQVKKNSLTESNAQDKQAEADAYANLLAAQKAEYDKKRELNSQIAEARKAIKGETDGIKENTEAIIKNGEELLKQGRAIRDKYGLISDQQKLDEELAALEKALQDGAILQQEYDTILAQIRQREQDAKQKSEDEKLKATQDRLEKERQARVKFGLEAERSEQQQELMELQQAHADKLLTDEEYEKAAADIREKYRKQEAEEIARALAETEQAEIDALQERLSKAADAIASWGGAVLDITNQVGELMSAKEDAELQEYEERNEEKKAALQERLDSGAITQDDYNKQVAAMDAELEKKQKENDLKQAKRNKAIAIMEAVINTALGISKAVAQNPMLGGLPGSVIAATMGALQIATIAAQPLPKASRGALLRGKSHAQGGIHIEAEGGEAIINKAATQRYLPLLSAINQSTGGVPLYANGGIPQQVIRQSEQAEFNRQELLDAIAQIRPQVAVTDINQGQANMTRITQRKNY